MLDGSITLDLRIRHLQPRAPVDGGQPSAGALRCPAAEEDLMSEQAPFPARLCVQCRELIYLGGYYDRTVINGRERLSHGGPCTIALRARLDSR
jgi:hypothetical protein